MPTKADFKRWAKRRQRVVALRKKGKTYKQIGDKLGISYQRARQIYLKEAENDTDQG